MKNQELHYYTYLTVCKMCQYYKNSGLSSSVKSLTVKNKNELPSMAMFQNNEENFIMSIVLKMIEIV